MRFRSIIVVFAALGLGQSAAALDFLAVDKAIVESGRTLYRQHCADCHGQDATGGSTTRVGTTVEAPSLTGLTKKHGGTFPFWELYEMVSGAELMPAHRGRVMPIWSDELAKTPKVGKADAKAIVRGRITAILAYLSSVQEK